MHHSIFCCVEGHNIQAITRNIFQCHVYHLGPTVNCVWQLGRGAFHILYLSLFMYIISYYILPWTSSSLVHVLINAKHTMFSVIPHNAVFVIVEGGLVCVLECLPPGSWYCVSIVFLNFQGISLNFAKLNFGVIYPEQEHQIHASMKSMFTIHNSFNIHFPLIWMDMSEYSPHFDGVYP